MKDRNQRDLELFAPLRNDLKKKICIGAVSHRTLQADRAEDVAGEIRKRAEAHPGRAADRVERLRLRPPGVQPRDRVLQGHARSRRAATSSAASSACRRPTCRPPIRSCRSTSSKRRADFQLRVTGYELRLRNGQIQHPRDLYS